jgi:hypothetical protein
MGCSLRDREKSAFHAEESDDEKRCFRKSNGGVTELDGVA